MTSNLHKDMEKDPESLYVFSQLLKAKDDIKNNRFLSASLLDEIEDAVLSEKK